MVEGVRSTDWEEGQGWGSGRFLQGTNYYQNTINCTDVKSTNEITLACEFLIMYRVFLSFPISIFLSSCCCLCFVYLQNKKQARDMFVMMLDSWFSLL